MNEIELNKIKLFQYITLEKFDFDKYPEHVSMKKYNGFNCSYAWKPIIIYQVCEKYGGLVHWMDTRNLYSDFKNLIKILRNNYIYSPISNGDIEKWSYPTTINYMNGFKYLKKRMRGAGIFGVNYDIDWVKHFIKEWKDLALIKECICPTGSNRDNHRQDQSVLTILYYKYQEIYKFRIIDRYLDLSPHNKLLKQVGVKNNTNKQSKKVNQLHRKKVNQLHRKKLKQIHRKKLKQLHRKKLNQIRRNKVK